MSDFRTQLWRRLAATAALAALLFASVLSPLPAGASSTSHAGAVSYSVTMVARYCPSYSDVFANRARNNIMESLNDLGPDSPYSSFTQVEPSVEDGLSPQTNCHPLSGWSFAFGTGIAANAVGTNLSYVTGTGSVANRVVTTQSSVPLLDSTGQPTGKQIAGATTFTLTQAEVDLATRSSSYWVMGGTPSAPLNGLGSQYGFAALRCATDNLNGDNVEWIGYPSNTTHVFCYAFYVQPPPHSATVTIRKQLSRAQPSAETFNFSGSLSYNPGGAFSLTVPQGGTQVDESFVRGETLSGDVPWSATESIPAGYQLTGLFCSSSGGSTFSYTGSSSSSSVPGGHDGVDITLTAGDNVLCTFSNTPDPARGELTSRVITSDGSPVPSIVLPATFNYTVINPSSSSSTVPVVVDAESQSGGTGVQSLTPGSWTITQQALPSFPGWHFSWLSTVCDVNGTLTSYPAGAVTLVVPPAGQGACAFTNLLVPTGSLTVRFTTLGGTGTFSAAIASQDGTQLVQTATTSTEGTATAASGDPTDPLLGSWSITPTTPAVTSSGRWVLASTPSCGSAPATNVGEEQLDVSVGTAAAPQVVCDYVYRFLPASTLEVTKLVTGDQSYRTGAVDLQVSCSDGSSATLSLGTGQNGPVSLDHALSFPLPVTCSVKETASGVSAMGGVETTSVVNVDGVPSGMTMDSVDVGSATSRTDVVVTVTNRYGRGLAATGMSPWISGTALLGIVLLGAGGALARSTRRRRVATES